VNVAANGRRASTRSPLATHLPVGVHQRLALMRPTGEQAVLW
jgi:hypothetical protein